MNRTSLTPYAASMRDPDPANAKRACREAYEKTDGEFVCINKRWLQTWTDRKQLDLLAEQALGIKGVE